MFICITSIQFTYVYFACVTFLPPVVLIYDMNYTVSVSINQHDIQSIFEVAINVFRN